MILRGNIKEYSSLWSSIEGGFLNYAQIYSIYIFEVCRKFIDHIHLIKKNPQSRECYNNRLLEPWISS